MNEPGASPQYLRARASRLTILLFALSLPSHATRAQPTADTPSAEDSPQLVEATACFRDAHAAYVAGDLARALSGFLCTYERAPSPELQWNLARVYDRMGEADEAIRHYRAYLAAADLSPKERKQTEQRIQAVEEMRARQLAVLTEPKPSHDALSAEARRFYDRGVKLFGRGQYQSAMAAFTAALHMSGAPELHYNLAVSAERLQRWQEASDHYRAYLAAAEDPADRETIEGRIAALRSRLQTGEPTANGATTRSSP
jgi:tetratricopeptide (TPR) repeat protein